MIGKAKDEKSVLPSNSLSKAKDVFEMQARALLDISDRLTSDIETAANLIISCSGKLIVSGMGKSGIIGRKIAATLASTGTPSFFVHPGEAYHGDLGMITRDDLVLLISYSGETDEILKLLPYLQFVEAKIIAFTGNSNSTLAKAASSVLNVSVEREACPNNLAPTASTTATLVMGDALAVILIEQRGFKALDFARFHPGGTLGRKLLTRAKDLVVPPVTVNANDDFKAIIDQINDGGLGVAIVNNGSEAIGLITDGDIRRALQTVDYQSLKARDLMSSPFLSVGMNDNLLTCESLMHDHKITALAVVDDESNIIGIIKSYDI